MFRQCNHVWYKLTPRIGVLVKLIVKQLVRTFPSFRGTASVITAFTKASYLSRCWAKGIQSASYNSFFFKIGFNTNLPSTPRSYSWSFPSGFPTKIVTNFSSALCVPQTHPSHSPSFECPYIVWWGMNVVSAFLFGFYTINGFFFFFLQILQLAVVLHEGPISITFKYWIDLKMFPAESLISKMRSVCFDHVPPESFWMKAVKIRNWCWLRDHAAISETLCLFLQVV